MGEAKAKSTDKEYGLAEAELIVAGERGGWMPGLVCDIASAEGWPSTAERVAELKRGIKPREASSLLLGRLSEGDRAKIVELLGEEGEE